MKIVLISPYFPPGAPPYASMLKALAARFSEDGHAVTVLTCRPSSHRSGGGVRASEMLEIGVRVRRYWGGSQNGLLRTGGYVHAVSFAVSVFTARRWLKRADVVVAVSSPPIVIGMVGLILARLCGAAFVYHKQDIHPDTAAAVGLGPPWVLMRMLHRLDSWTDRQADRVVVLSRDMAMVERSRGVAADRLRVINNFDPWDLPDRQPRVDETDSRNAVFRAVFAGNLGRFQGLTLLLIAAEALQEHRDIVIEVIGEGVMKRELERTANELDLRNVSFHDYMAPADLAHYLRQHPSVGVVSLERGVIRTAYPSKTMSYLRNGCPVIAIVERDSELAQDLERNNAGRAVPPGDWSTLVSVVLDLRNDSIRFRSMQKAAFQLYADTFTRKARLDQWATLLENMATREPTGPNG